MNVYKLDIYLDDGMVRGNAVVWVGAFSEEEAQYKVKNFYNSQYDTFVRINSVSVENQDIIFTEIARNTTTYYN